MYWQPKPINLANSLVVIHIVKNGRQEGRLKYMEGQEKGIRPRWCVLWAYWFEQEIKAGKYMWRGYLGGTTTMYQGYTVWRKYPKIFDIYAWFHLSSASLFWLVRLETHCPSWLVHQQTGFICFGSLLPWGHRCLSVEEIAAYPGIKRDTVLGGSPKNRCQHTGWIAFGNSKRIPEFQKSEGQ